MHAVRFKIERCCNRPDGHGSRARSVGDGCGPAKAILVMCGPNASGWIDQSISGGLDSNRTRAELREGGCGTAAQKVWCVALGCAVLAIRYGGLQVARRG
jgi:hypothetical protein